MYNDSVEVARVLPAASGGFQVNNTLTGAGNERVLTESDLGQPDETGSFTVDFDVGFTGPNVVTIQYQRYGDIVHILMPTANFGNSNATTLGTGNDWPVGLRPASTRYGSTVCTDNSATQILASFFLNSAGALDFNCPTTSGRDWGNNWTAAGVKGVNAGWTWTYRITDS
jgi:hypothetical protein